MGWARHVERRSTRHGSIVEGVNVRVARQSKELVARDVGQVDDGRNLAGIEDLQALRRGIVEKPVSHLCDLAP